MILYKIKNIQSGQSLAEIVIALALVAVFLSVVGVSLLFGLESAGRGRDYLQAQMLAREGVEAARSVYYEDWDNPNYNQSAIVVSDNAWTLSGEGTSEQIGKFSRQINFNSLYRASSTNEIVESSDPDAYLDALSKKISVNITWERSNGQNSIYTLESIISDW